MAKIILAACDEQQVVTYILTSLDLENMMKVSVLVMTLLVAVSSLSVMAGEFGNRCTTALTKGEVVNSDCSINSQFKGNTLCFGNEDARKVFMQTQDKQQFVEKAAAFYPTVLTGQVK